MNQPSDFLPSTPSNQPRLWFGFAGSATAWMLLFIVDLLLAWKMCRRLPSGFDVISLGWILYLMAAVTVLMLVIAIGAGLVSFRDFARLSKVSLADAEATGREEFMALGGVFLSVVMSLGVVWMGLPFIILQVCTRAR